MPAYRKNDLSKHANGQFQRVIGWVQTRSGRRGQRFLLGKDEHKARLAVARLLPLWDSLVSHQRVHERDALYARLRARLAQVFPQLPSQSEAYADVAQPNPTDSDEVLADLDRQMLLGLRPLEDNQVVWRPDALELAKHIAKHPTEPYVWKLPPYDPPRLVCEMLKIRTRFAVVDDLIAFERTPNLELAEEVIRGKASYHLEKSQRYAHTVSQPQLASLNGTTWQCLDAFAERERTRYTKDGQLTESGKDRIDTIERLKRMALPDIDMASFDIAVIERMVDQLSNPPQTKWGKPLSPAGVKKLLKIARAWMRWADEREPWGWSMPKRALDTLHSLRPSSLRTPEERAKLVSGVDAFTVDELMILFRTATRRERCLMLMGLNCGFTQGEIIQLHPDEYQAKLHRIRRLRGKTIVPAQWKLWPETETAIAWWRRHVGGDSKHVFCVKGGPLNRNYIANTWNRLLSRVRKQHPDFNTLSFKFLRKTGSTLVRQLAGGEISGIYLSHSSPYQGDRFLEVYAKRDFAKLDGALDEIREQLRPMFAAAEAGSPEPPLKSRRGRSGGGLDPESIQDIRRRRAEGQTQKRIAVDLGLSAATVGRYVTKR